MLSAVHAGIQYFSCVYNQPLVGVFFVFPGLFQGHLLRYYSHSESSRSVSKQHQKGKEKVKWFPRITESRGLQCTARNLPKETLVDLGRKTLLTQ